MDDLRSGVGWRFGELVGHKCPTYSLDAMHGLLGLLAGTVLYPAEILGCKACFAGMASSYRTLVPGSYRALVSGSYRR